MPDILILHVVGFQQCVIGALQLLVCFTQVIGQGLDLTILPMNPACTLDIEQDRYQQQQCHQYAACERPNEARIEHMLMKEIGGGDDIDQRTDLPYTQTGVIKGRVRQRIMDDLITGMDVSAVV